MWNPNLANSNGSKISLLEVLNFDFWSIWATFKSQIYQISKFRVDRHISRISRENGKWFCETFLARNAAREIAGKSYQFLANLKSNLVKNCSFFQAKITNFQLKSAIPFLLHSFWRSNNILSYYFENLFLEIVWKLSKITKSPNSCKK